MFETVVDSGIRVKDFGFGLTPVNLEGFPDHIPSLIRMALADLRLVEQDPRYTVNMDTWHRQDYYWPDNYVAPVKKCHVCLAGATLAKTAGYDPTEEYEPIRLLDPTARYVRTLNALRLGSLDSAYHIMHERCPPIPECHIDPYDHTNPDNFHEQLERLAVMLNDYDPVTT